ncbi:hypothetical protein AF331_12470 [Rossellomorea marisflavi]|uniref:Uncharacterized protein n=1 Tax=Rossellomorea marisflavi TaxID=189381 RepID=A0A0M0G5W0_9BACI|nr:DUF3238 domain-containing protein [Rossellomorea marisflavi]KON84821.1 hypothetical protein AF331_12470 [Rossellomorea marisflavi]
MKKILFVTLIAFLIFMTTGLSWGSDRAEANNSKFNLQEFNIKKSPNSISIEWNKVSNAIKYGIVYEDRIIYLGEDSVFLQTDLEEGSLNEYYIAAIDNKNRVIDKAYVKAFTPIEDDEYGDVGVDALANENSVVLNWPVIENAEEYTIYKDGEEVSTSTENLYLSENLKENSSYEFTIGTRVRMTEDRIKEIKEEIALYLEKAQEQENREADEFDEEQVQDEEEYTEDIGTLYDDLEREPFDFVETTTPIKTLPPTYEDMELEDLTKSSEFSTMATLPANTWIKINTMILNSKKFASGYLKGPGTSKYYFATDKRKSITDSGSTRTTLTAKIKWSDRSTTQTKGVGATKRYTKNSNGTYKFKDSKTASGNNVYFGVTKKTKSMVDINFKHKANNPYYIASPNVEYEFRSEIYRDGTTKMRGYHTLFPSIGIFRSNGSGYKTLYTHNQGERSPWSLYKTKLINISKKTK